jgi:peptide subunit release factor 1 (eRF1)
MDTDTIKTLQNAESVINSTTLITLYVQSGKNLWIAANHITNEIKTASNIKDKNVSKLVIHALKSIQHRLKMLKNLPENGVVLCAGDYKLNSTDTFDKKKSYV